MIEKIYTIGFQSYKSQIIIFLYFKKVIHPNKMAISSHIQCFTLHLTPYQAPNRF